MTALNEIEEALRWVDTQKRLHFGEIALLKGFAFDGKKYKFPRHFQTILDALALAEKVRDGYVLMPRTPNKKIIAAMKKCEGGEYTIREGWTLIIDAAQTEEKQNDET